jgi:hypothetical protein
MLRITIADIEPLSSSDTVDFEAISNLEEIACYMLSASKTPGALGYSACQTVDEILAASHDAALSDVLDILPIEIGELLIGDGFPKAVKLITDGRGSYCMIALEVEALIGTGQEIAQVLAGCVMRAARHVAGNTGYPADARYEAALLAKTKLTIVS